MMLFIARMMCNITSHLGFSLRAIERYPEFILLIQSALSMRNRIEGALSPLSDS